MEKNIQLTRTINNALILGDTKKTAKQVTIKEPYSMIPMEEGIRLVPLDIDFTGVKMETIELTTDKVMYTQDVADVIKEEYEKLLKNAGLPVLGEEQEIK